MINEKRDCIHCGHAMGEREGELLCNHCKPVKKIKSANPYHDAISSEQAIAEAKRDGKIIVEPDDYTLQIDIDNDEAYNRMNERLSNLYNWDYYPVIEKTIVSFSGLPHRHVYISVLKELSCLERIILQMYLGSDPKREFLSLMRDNIGDSMPTKFFERKTDGQDKKF